MQASILGAMLPLAGAWGSAERTVRPNQAPGTARSSVWRAAPVTLAGASRRGAEAPIKPLTGATMRALAARRQGTLRPPRRAEWADQGQVEATLARGQQAFTQMHVVLITVRMVGIEAPSAARGDRQVDQRIVITLDAGDLLELERILIDRDEKDALRFLHERIEKKVHEATRAHIRPPFE